VAAPPDSPDPRVAAWLSALLPGLGQLWVGSLLLAPLFAAAWLVALFGMLDLASSNVLRSRAEWPLLVAADVALGAGAWFMAVRHAHARALAIARGEAPARETAWSRFTRSLLAGRWTDLALALGYWWGYELAGSLFLTFFLSLVEASEHRRANPLGRLLAFAATYLAGTLALHLALHAPVPQLLSCGLLLLLDYAPALLFSGEDGEREFLGRGARSFALLVTGFFAVALAASTLERLGVAAGRRELFDVSVMVAWGAFHFLVKALVENALGRRSVTPPPLAP
jgi:hypothetical protein